MPEKRHSEPSGTDLFIHSGADITLLMLPPAKGGIYFRFRALLSRSVKTGHIHFDFTIHHQVRYAADAGRRVVAKELAKYLIERLKIARIGEDHFNMHHVGRGCSPLRS